MRTHDGRSAAGGSGGAGDPSGRLTPRAARVHINEEFAPVEAFINEYVADISSTGVFIKSKDPLPIGTRVNLKFSVILDELHVVEAAGEVVRLNARPLGMGVAFRAVGPDAQKIIGRAVKERRACKVR